MALYSSGLVTGSLFFSYLSDRIHRRRFIMIGGLFAFIGTSFILLFSKTIWLYRVGRLAQGFTAAINWVVSLEIIADTGNSSNISYHMGFPGMGMAIPMFLGSLLGGIIYDKSGYNTIFMVCFGVLAVDIVLSLFMLEKGQLATTREKFAIKHVDSFQNLDHEMQE